MTTPDPTDPLEVSNLAAVASPESPIVAAGHQAQAAQGAVWTLVYVLGAIPLALVANIVISRALGPAGYGQVSVFIIVLGIATELAHFGYGTAAIRWGAAAWARGERDAFLTTLSKSLGWHVLVQAPVLAVVAVLLGGISEPALIAPLIVGVVLPCASSSAALLLTMKSRTDRLARFSLLSVTLVQVSTMTAAALSQRADVTWATTLVASGLASTVLFLALSPEERREARTLRVPRAHPEGFVRFASLSGANAVLQMLVATRSEVIILAVLGYATETGQFALAFGVAAMITAPVDVIIGPLVPAAIGLLQTAPERAREAYLRALQVTCLFTGFLLAVIVPPVAMLIPFVYGDAYAESVGVFIVLAAASCLVSITNPALAFLNARGIVSGLVRRSVYALALNVSAALALIPVFGLWGAAMANAVGSLANCIPIIALHRKDVDIRWSALASVMRPMTWSALLLTIGSLVVLMRDDAHVWEPCLLGLALLALWPLGIRLGNMRMTSEQRNVIVDSLPGRRVTGARKILVRFIELIS